jgi:hypothetical protein
MALRLRALLTVSREYLRLLLLLVSPVGGSPTRLEWMQNGFIPNSVG